MEKPSRWPKDGPQKYLNKTKAFICTWNLNFYSIFYNDNIRMLFVCLNNHNTTYETFEAHCKAFNTVSSWIQMGMFHMCMCDNRLPV